MSSNGLYVVASATLAPVLVTLLMLYSIGIGFQFTVVALIIGVKTTLKRNFILFSIASISCTLIGFLICLLFLMTVNFECTLGRKVAYSFFYIGFLLYDIYQIKNVIKRTRPHPYVFWGILGLFACRIASVIYNVVFVQGVIAIPIAAGLPNGGGGSCKSLFTNAMVYQEHSTTSIFELAIVSQVVYHAFKLSSNKVTLYDIVMNIFDFETKTFTLYFVAEVLYIFIFSIIPESWISYLNTIYLQLPALLFLANACIFVQPRELKAEKVGIKVPSARGLPSNNGVKSGNKSGVRSVGVPKKSVSVDPRTQVRPSDTSSRSNRAAQVD